MKFSCLCPDDDRPNLIIEKTGEDSVKFSFEVLPDYIWKLAVTLSTTIWGCHSGWERVKPKVKWHLNKICHIADYEPIYRDNENNLKIVMSSWSDDVTIANWFNEPKRLWEKYDITINKDNSIPEIIDELLLILNEE